MSKLTLRAAIEGLIERPETPAKEIRRLWQAAIVARAPDVVSISGEIHSRVFAAGEAYRQAQIASAEKERES